MPLKRGVSVLKRKSRYRGPYNVPVGTLVRLKDARDDVALAVVTGPVQDFEWYPVRVLATGEDFNFMRKWFVIPRFKKEQKNEQ